MNYIISIDQSTSATKAVVFDESCRLVCRKNVPHKQYYPKPGWVEHDPEEIYRNAVEAVREVVAATQADDANYSLAITNQRETVVVWNRLTGKPVYNAVVWQCQRGADICEDLKQRGYAEFIRERSGLLIDQADSLSTDEQEMEDIREWIYRLQDFVRMFGDAIFDACEVGDEKLDHLTQQWLDSDISTIGANIRDIADEYLDGEIDDEAVVSKVKECLDLYLN